MSARGLVGHLPPVIGCCTIVLCIQSAGAAPGGIRIGVLQPGPLDAITDVPGVRVGQVTKIEGSGPLRPGIGPVRTGVTVVLPNDDPWEKRVAAATGDLNGNGEMTGTHWINESGFLEEPIALTNTMNVARVDDGVEDWLLTHHPLIGIREDVPLPVVAECDDEDLNDIQGRHVSRADTVRALETAKGGAFPRGDVGAGTGMTSFDFKGGIGTASRVVSKHWGGYTVGALVNDNSGLREQLIVGGVPVGRILAHNLLPVVPKAAAASPRKGRAVGGSIIVVIATNAPLEHRQLRELATRGELGIARTGLTSRVSSGDLLLAFSTTRVYPRDEGPTRGPAVLTNEEALDALFDAVVEATEAAIIDALLSAKTMTGANGRTVYALPVDRVRTLLRAARQAESP